MKLTIPKFYYDTSFKSFKDELTQGRPQLNLPAGYPLVKAGEYMYSSYYVHTGVLKFYIISDNGDEKTEWFIGPGGLFPLYSPLERHYRNERDSLLLKAQTSCKVTKIPQSEIDHLLDHDAKLAKRMLRQYADFSSILLYDSITLATQDNTTKICNYLYQYETLLKPHGIILTQKEIAINIGVSLLTLSRTLTRLRHQGIIATSRKMIEVLDWPNLIALCSPDLLTDE
jgi:CRP-like cAMP-binding protein